MRATTFALGISLTMALFGLGCPPSEEPCFLDGDCRMIECGREGFRPVCVVADEEIRGICECVDTGAGGNSGTGGDGAGGDGAGGDGAGGNGAGGMNGTGGTGATGGSGSGPCNAGLPAGAPSITVTPVLSPTSGPPGTEATLELNFGEGVTEAGWLLIQSGTGQVVASGTFPVAPGTTFVSIDFTVADVPAGNYILQLLLFGTDPAVRTGYASDETCTGAMEFSEIENGVEGPFTPLPGCSSSCFTVEQP